jgi:hypothetical protein
MPQQYLYQPNAGMLQQYYATAMPQPVAQSAPVNQELISQYNQQVIPAATAVPEVVNYAPQQKPQQQTLQPDQRRIAYNKLIEDRFNELANQFGGINRLVEMDSVELAKKKAAADIASYWGPPPTPERPLNELERVQLEKERLALEKTKNPQMSELDRVKLEQEKLALEQAQKSMGKAETERMKAEADKLKSAQENISLASDVVSSVDKLLSNENALQWAGGKTGAILGKLPGETRGIRQQIEQLRDQIGLFGRKAIVGQGQGSISDAEQKMAKEALAQVITEGTDEQLIESLKAVRQKFGGILSRIQSETTGQQPSSSNIQQSGQPKVRTWVPGKGFQD